MPTRKPKAKPNPVQPTTEPKLQPNPADEPHPAAYLTRYEDDGGAAAEEIELTAEQFRALKEHLATLQPGSPDPDDARAWHGAREARQTDLQDRAKIIRDLLGDLDDYELGAMETAKLIRSRTVCGKNGPIDKFLFGLLRQYQLAEDRGMGLTVEDVESELAELRDNMQESLSEAYFIAERYPRPEVSDAQQ